MTDYELEIVLIVGGQKLPRPIDLETLKDNLDGYFKTYNDQPGLYYGFEEGDKSFTFYEGDEEGAPYIIRAGNKKQLDEKHTEILNRLTDLGVITEDEASELSLDLYNYVATGNLNKQLNLKTLTLALRSYDDDQNLQSTVEYEPEQFPPIVYLGPESPSKALVFGNGKVVLPGGKTKEECSTTFRLLIEVLADRFPSRFDEPGEITFVN